MKTLVFSDLHLHNWNYGSSLINGMNSRLLDQRRVLSKIHEYLVDHPIDNVVFCGDLFHTHGKIDAAVLKTAYEGLLPIVSGWETTFLVGNHDTATKDMSIHSLHWLQSFKRVKIVHDEHHDSEKQLSFLSYTESKKILQNFFSRAEHLCFTHQGIANVPMGSGFLINEIFDVGMIPSHVEHVFSGHYHNHANPSPKATIVGSTLQLNWSDSGDSKGFLVVDTNTCKFERVIVKSPEFILYDCNQDHPVSVENNFVRVTNYEGVDTENLRGVMTALGARSVEFAPITKEAPPLTALKSTSLDLPQLVSEYEKERNVTEERSLIGKDLMK